MTRDQHDLEGLHWQASVKGMCFCACRQTGLGRIVSTVLLLGSLAALSLGMRGLFFVCWSCSDGYV